MPFQPGQSGNPKGRPRADKFITQHLIAELREIDPKTNSSGTRAIVQALIDKAKDGDVSAIREVMDRVEGKVTQPIGGDEENPLVLTIEAAGASVDAKFDRIVAGATSVVPSEPDGS